MAYLCHTGLVLDSSWDNFLNHTGLIPEVILGLFLESYWADFLSHIRLIS